MLYAILRTGVALTCLCSIGFAQVVDDTTSVERFEELEGKVESLQESSIEVRNIVDALRKFKFSGYVQTQYRATDLINQPYPIGQFSGGTFSNNVKSQLQLRRGRLKVQYDGGSTNAVLQIDIGQSGLSVKDAYFAFTEPWIQTFSVQAGIFDRPFGYEISFSSSSRETPERSRIFQTLFPGERDLGVKLVYAPQIGTLSFLRGEVGVFNGTGANASEFDNFKDIIGRIGAQFPFDDIATGIDLGVSGYIGKVRSNSPDIYRHTTLLGGMPGFVKSTDSAHVGRGVTRRYIGIDAQVYYDMPLLGGLILRGEYITGTQPGTASGTISPSTQPTSPLYERKMHGWYVMLVQNLGDQNQIIAKYDVYDPNREAASRDFSTMNTLTVADIKYQTLGLGFIHHWDANIKFTAYYEIVKNEELEASKIDPTSPLFTYTKDVRDNVFTFRIQYKF